MGAWLELLEEFCTKKPHLHAFTTAGCIMVAHVKTVSSSALAAKSKWQCFGKDCISHSKNSGQLLSPLIIILIITLIVVKSATTFIFQQKQCFSGTADRCDRVTWISINLWPFHSAVLVKSSAPVCGRHTSEYNTVWIVKLQVSKSATDGVNSHIRITNESDLLPVVLLIFTNSAFTKS